MLAAPKGTLVYLVGEWRSEPLPLPIAPFACFAAGVNLGSRHPRPASFWQERAEAALAAIRDAGVFAAEIRDDEAAPQAARLRAGLVANRLARLAGWFDALATACADAPRPDLEVYVV